MKEINQVPRRELQIGEAEANPMDHASPSAAESNSTRRRNDNDPGNIFLSDSNLNDYDYQQTRHKHKNGHIYHSIDYTNHE